MADELRQPGQLDREVGQTASGEVMTQTHEPKKPQEESSREFTGFGSGINLLWQSAVRVSLCKI